MSKIEELKQILELIIKIDSANEEDIRFCISLAEKVSQLIENSANKPNYELNILDVVNIAEPLTSIIISLIFKYRLDGKYILCNSFLTHFLAQCGFIQDWIESPIVTAETDRIDICVRERGKYAVIIENKLKGAVFQRNQLARYVQIMRNAGYSDKKIFVIVLPNHIDRSLFDNINKSVWFLPPDWDEPNRQRKCADKDAISCLCDFGLSCDNCKHCKMDIRERFQSRTRVLDIEFIEWLENICIPLIPMKEIVLRSAVQQFVDFLKGIFNQRLNKKLIMEIEEFLRKELLDSKVSSNDQWRLLEQKKKDLDNIKSGIVSLQKSISKDMIDTWYESLSDKWGKWLKRKKQESFGINIQGVWCGCWCDEDCEFQPWWGFQCDNPTPEQYKMVNDILEYVGFGSGKSNKWYISWEHTLHGDERCDQLYQAAVKLGFL